MMIIRTLRRTCSAVGAMAVGAMLAAAFVAVTGWRTRPPETLGDVRADVTEWYK